MIWISNCWSFVTAWPRGFVAWCHAAICALTTEEGRKGWAMLAALGCCFVMTAEVGAGLWLLHNRPWPVFWIALSAQGVNFVVVTGLMVLLGIKRKTSVGLDMPGGGKVSLGLDDSGQPVVVTQTPVAPPPAPTVAPPPAPMAPNGEVPVAPPNV